jgi:NhaP-type Na+/H+ or K+/H+ antiporter
MYGRNVQHVEPVLILLLILVVGLAILAKRFRTPYPIVLVIGGLLLSLVPHMPHAELNPEVVFLVFLPPLLFSAAFQASWRDFRYNLVSIAMLAFGLVGFTVYGIAAVAPSILPGFDWHLGLVLGAVVCTTDAIAATSIARRLGLPRRIRDVIEGESLFNDASGTARPAARRRDRSHRKRAHGRGADRAPALSRRQRDRNRARDRQARLLGGEENR